MKQIVLFFFLIVSAANAMGEGVPDNSDAVKIMKVGDFHGVGEGKPAGKNWFALIQSGNRCELKRVIPTVKTVYDPVMDDENDKANYSGIKVAVKGLNPLLLIQSKNLKVGSVVQAKVSNSKTIQLNALSYELRRECKTKKTNTEDIQTKKCNVYLTHGKCEQFIADTTENNDEFDRTVKLIWAGDIDRDGKLDMILEYSNYNNSSTVLYLSSEAKKGELAGKAAEFNEQGC